MPRMVAFFGLGCSIALAIQENALSMVQMNVQKQFVSDDWVIRGFQKLPADDGSDDNTTVNTAINTTLNTSLDKTAIKEIVEDVVERIIEDFHPVNASQVVEAQTPKEAYMEGAETDCHDMGGEYEDQKSGNTIIVHQTGCFVNVDMMWDEIRGRVLQQGTVAVDQVTINEFDEAGKFTDAGDITFLDGGYWKKMTSNTTNSSEGDVVFPTTNATGVAQTVVPNDTSANASNASVIDYSDSAQQYEAAEAAFGEEEEEALQQQRTGAELADDISSETNASVVSSASHWGSPGTCKVTEDTFFSVFDGVKADASLLQADIDSDTDTNTDAGFRLKDFLKDGEAKDLWLIRGRAHDGSTVRIAARYWRNASSTGHQVFLKSLAVSGGFITNRTLVVRPLQDEITWNNQKETYAILKNKDSAFSIEGLVSATRKASWTSNVVSGSTVEVQLPKEVKLVITRHQKFLNLAISMPPLATQDGLCGNFNGDSSDDKLGMILSRGPRVKDENSMFPAEWVPPKAAPAQVDGEMFTESRNDVVSAHDVVAFELENDH